MCDLTGKLCSSGIFVQCMHYWAPSSDIWFQGCHGDNIVYSICKLLFIFLYFTTLTTKLCWQQKSCQSDESVGKIIKFLHLRTRTFFYYFLALLACYSSRELFIKCPLSPSGVWGFLGFNFFSRNLISFSRNKPLIFNISIFGNPKLCY